MSDDHKALTKADRGTVYRDAPSRMHPLAEAIVGSGQQLTPKAMQGLLDVQKDWEAHEAKKLFTRAMVELKRDLPRVIRHDAKVDFTSSKGRTHYTHATLPQVTEAVTEHLNTHGFSVNFYPSVEGNKVTVRCVLSHQGGHSEEAAMPGAIDTSGNKNAIQGAASTVTYLRRYLLLSMLGIATADMKEPKAADPKAVDSRRNEVAADYIKKQGFSLAEAEAHVGSTWPKWTNAQADEIKSWLNRKMEAAKQEPPHDPVTGEVSQ